MNFILSLIYYRIFIQISTRMTLKKKLKLNLSEMKSKKKFG